MTPLRHALTDYLAMRRALGYRLVRAETLLAQFVAYVEGRGSTRCAPTRRWRGRPSPPA